MSPELRAVQPGEQPPEPPRPGSPHTRAWLLLESAQEALEAGNESYAAAAGTVGLGWATLALMEPAPAEQALAPAEESSSGVYFGCGLAHFESDGPCSPQCWKNWARS